MDETSWGQKSREVWLKEGDRNIRFFHKIAHSHKRRNNINKIRINGEWLIGESEIRQGVVEAFKNLLTNLGERTWKI